MPRKLTTEEFVERSSRKYPGKFTYENTDYLGYTTNLLINCVEHGEFSITASNHLTRTSKGGCRTCKSNKASKRHLKTQETFLQELEDKYPGKFNTSEVVYINAKTDIILTCIKHQNRFNKNPQSLLVKGRISGCKDCQYEDLANNRSLTWDQFVEKANAKHNNRYEYLTDNYKNNSSRIEVTCKEHGVFVQAASHHMNGTACPTCSKQSKGERNVREILNQLGITYRAQENFEGCKNIRQLPFDFFLPDLNILIEYQGIHHSEPREFFGGEPEFKKRQYLDWIKRKWCERSPYQLYEIYHDEDVKSRLLEILNLN